MFAPVAFLVIEACHLEEKAPASPSQLASSLVRADVPDRFQLNADRRTTDKKTVEPVDALAVLVPVDRAFVPDHSQFRNIFHLSGVMSAHSATLSLEDEMADVFDQVQGTSERRVCCQRLQDESTG